MTNLAGLADLRLLEELDIGGNRVAHATSLRRLSHLAERARPVTDARPPGGRCGERLRLSGGRERVVRQGNLHRARRRRRGGSARRARGLRVGGPRRAGESGAPGRGVVGRAGFGDASAVGKQHESAIFRLLTPRIPHRHSSRSLRWYSTPSIPRFRHIPKYEPRSVECRAFR